MTLLWAQGDNRLILDGELPKGAGPGIMKAIENAQAAARAEQRLVDMTIALMKKKARD
jgi:hypothetical protein